MIIRMMTLTAIAALACGCGPDTPDRDPAASQNDENQQAATEQMAAREPATGTRMPATEAAGASRSATAENAGAGGDYTEVLGKMVVNSSNGSLLGNTEGVAREMASEKTFAIVAVSNAEGMKRKEVVVPLADLSNDVVPEKLKLAMTREQLIAQPEAQNGDYKEVARWKTDPTSVDDSASSGQQSPMSQPTSGQSAPTSQ